MQTLDTVLRENLERASEGTAVQKYVSPFSEKPGNLEGSKDQEGYPSSIPGIVSQYKLALHRKSLRDRKAVPIISEGTE